MVRVIHFELFAEEPVRIGRFYREVFGWQLDRWDGPAAYWQIRTGEGEGIDGGLAVKREGMPGVVTTLEVASVDEVVARVLRQGGAVVRPKRSVRGVGYLAYCRDPGGNVFGLLQRDPRAP
jgi:predicted enzyme related to lactoylglutathione lyase